VTVNRAPLGHQYGWLMSEPHVELEYENV